MNPFAPDDKLPYFKKQPIGFVKFKKVKHETDPFKMPSFTRIAPNMALVTSIKPTTFSWTMATTNSGLTTQMKARRMNPNSKLLPPS